MIIISLRNIVITPWPTVGRPFLTVDTGMQNTGNIWLTLNLSRQVDALLNGLPFLNFKTNAAVFAVVRIFIKQSGRFNY